jgi:hypothetical protein
LATDPFLAQIQAQMKAMSEQDTAFTRSQLNSMLVQYGAVPNIPKNARGLLDPTTARLAQQNTAAGTSILARLGKEHTDTTRRIPDNMAARGILFSGETGYQLGEEANRFKLAQYDATQGLLQQVSGAYQAMVDRENDRRMQLIGAQQDAAQRQQEIQFRQQEMAQQMQMAQMQAAQEAAANAAYAQSFSQPAYSEPAYSAPAGPVGPSPQELQIMAGAVGQAARHRSPQEVQLFQKYTDWRNANPNWWQ